MTQHLPGFAPRQLMTDASQVKDERLGPFQLDRRSRLKDKDRDDLLGTDLGRVYQAHNVHTGAPAVVVIPGQREDVRDSQRRLCEEHGTPFIESPLDMKVGISPDVRSGLMPINGLRHPIQGDTTGWYIWAGGEPSADPDFFQPVHVAHLADWCPLALKFLGLPPGWRFLVAEGHEDVWEDPTLLDI